MRVLIINSSDIAGGAAKAAYRLHKALVSCDVDSQMLVQNKSSDDYTVLSEERKIYKYINKLRPLLDSLPVRFYKNRTKTLFSPSFLPFSNIVKKIIQINPDIVHLHWICGGMMRIEDIVKIKVPIVWSLHDNWAFTGGCHIKWECDKYLSSCEACPRLGSIKKNDLSHKIFSRKQKVFSRKIDMTIVGLSHWVNECSKNSALLKYKKHTNLPNPIDTELFRPFDKERARELWNLPKDKKLVLFGANSATSDINKGFKELSKALGCLRGDAIELVVFGSSKPQNAPNFGFEAHYLGHLHDDVSLVTLYGAVDVMVVPSLQENLSNVIMESLACGVPVVAFNVGGNLDLIDHQQNGYLAEPFSSDDLAHGIEWILNNSEYDMLRSNAVLKIKNNFDSKIVAQKYIRLYEEILS